MGMAFRVLEMRLSSLSEQISGAQARITCDPHWSERDGRVRQCLQVFNFQHVGGILPSSPRNSDQRRAVFFFFNRCDQHAIIVSLSSGVCDASLGWRLQPMRQSDVLSVETVRYKDESTFRKQKKNNHGRGNWHFEARLRSLRYMTVRLPEVRREEHAAILQEASSSRPPDSHPLPCQIASNQVMKWKRRRFSSHSLRCGKTKVMGCEVIWQRSDFGSGLWAEQDLQKRKLGCRAKHAFKTAKWQVFLKFIKAFSSHEGPSEFVKALSSLIVSLGWVRAALILIDPHGFKMSSLVTQVLQRFECPARNTITNSTSGSSIAAKPITLCQNPCQLPVGVGICFDLPWFALLVFSLSKINILAS